MRELQKQKCKQYFDSRQCLPMLVKLANPAPWSIPFPEHGPCSSDGYVVCRAELCQGCTQVSKTGTRVIESQRNSLRQGRVRKLSSSFRVSRTWGAGGVNTASGSSHLVELFER